MKLFELIGHARVSGFVFGLYKDFCKQWPNAQPKRRKQSTTMTTSKSGDESDQKRLALIASLILLNRPVEDLVRELSSFPYDFLGPPILLYATHVRNIIDRVRGGALTMEDARAWANAIEFRDDIKISGQTEADEKKVFDAVFLISTPEISGLSEKETLETAYSILA